jgi:hypothetical protein
MMISSRPTLRRMKYRVYIRNPINAMAMTTCVHITPKRMGAKSSIAIVTK